MEPSRASSRTCLRGAGTACFEGNDRDTGMVRRGPTLFKMSAHADHPPKLACLCSLASPQGVASSSITVPVTTAVLATSPFCRGQGGAGKGFFLDVDDSFSRTDEAKMAELLGRSFDEGTKGAWDEHARYSCPL